MNLIYLNGENQGCCWPLTPPGICIGREADNDLQLLEDGVSRYHAKITFDGNDWYIEDLGSSNGTFIGQNKITGREKLTQGAIISIGVQVFSFGQIQAAGAVSATNAADDNSAPEDQGDLASEIRKSKHSIFGGGSKNNGKGSKNAKKSKLGNLIFTLLIITLPLVGISGYMMWEKQKEIESKRPKKEAVEHPFFLYYEKIQTNPENIVRIEVKIENEKVFFTVDDLKYGRHFTKEITLNKEKLDKVKAGIRKTEFHKLKNDDANAPVGPLEMYRRIDLALDGKFNSIFINTKYGQSSFEQIESMIFDIAKDHNIQTGLLTEDEMRELANQCFIQAEEQFRNYQASPKNIREAIEKYQAALDYYSQFEPKPKEWNICRKQLERAKKIYGTMYDEYLFNIKKHSKMNRPDLASQECGKMLELIGPNHPKYQDFRGYKMEFDKQSNAMKKTQKKRKK